MFLLWTGPISSDSHTVTNVCTNTTPVHRTPSTPAVTKLLGRHGQDTVRESCTCLTSPRSVWGGLLFCLLICPQLGAFCQQLSTLLSTAEPFFVNSWVLLYQQLTVPLSAVGRFNGSSWAYLVLLLSSHIHGEKLKLCQLQP